MKTIKKLLESPTTTTYGNHWVLRLPHGLRRFGYHQTVICIVDDVTNEFAVTDGGWDTPSTSRAINVYKEQLSATHSEVEFDKIRKDVR